MGRKLAPAFMKGGSQGGGVKHKIHRILCHCEGAIVTGLTALAMTYLSVFDGRNDTETQQQIRDGKPVPYGQ